MASSSYMMSSAGKDLSTSLKEKVGKPGKTHIEIGSLSYSGKKDSKVEASSNLDDTEEDDSESMSMSVSASGNKAA